MKLLAIDPGNTESAWVLWNGSAILNKGKQPNDNVLDLVDPNLADTLAIEMIASYGMPVGAEVFETCVWIGRFVQAWHDTCTNRESIPTPLLVPRLKIKLGLCHNPKANDSNIRQALIDKVGQQGTKKHPGATYGVSKDIWAALALAVYITDSTKNGSKIW